MGMTKDGLSCWQAESEGIDLPDTTLGDLVDRRAEEVPEREAVVCSCSPELGGALDIRWTYAGYRARIDAVARGLVARGLPKGDHVAVWAAHLPEWLLLEFATAKARLAQVTINPVYRLAGLEYVLKQGDVKALFFYVNIVGRLKETVIHGGANIFPRESEKLLLRHPKVADAQVLGVPDASFGEELLAAVLPREGVEISEQELRAFCKERISHQKIPRYIQFVSAYPMTASGKVQKFVLRERAIETPGLQGVARTRTA
jgi:acyl-CoA synthetase (AMP-forming)/AMP-acid ligase II